MKSMEQYWNDTDRGKPKYAEKNVFPCHFSHHRFCRWNMPVVLQLNIYIYIYLLIYLFIYLFKTPPYATQFTNLYISSFGFLVKWPSDLFIINSHINNLYLHMQMRSHSLTLIFITNIVRELDLNPICRYNFLYGS